MKGSTRFYLGVILVVAAMFTGLCVGVERSRSAALEAETLAEEADSLRAATVHTTKLILDFIAEADKIPLERFDEIAGDAGTECAHYFPASELGFSFCRLHKTAEERVAASKGAVYGLPDLDARTLGEATNLFAGEDCATQIGEVVALTESLDERGAGAWSDLFGGERGLINLAGSGCVRLPAGGWSIGVSAFQGITVDLKPCFSGGFHFACRGKSLFMVRRVRGPGIDFCIQGTKLNRDVFLKMLAARLREVFPNASLRFSGFDEERSFVFGGLPLKVDLSASGRRREREADLNQFRFTLAATWLAGTAFLGTLALALTHLSRMTKKQRLFAAGIAHDLRSPLVELDARVNILKEDGFDDRSLAARRVCELYECLQRFGTLLDNLILAAKLAPSGTRYLQFLRGEFGEISLPIFERLSYHLKIYGLDLDVQLSPEAERAVLDFSPLALERIFTNLGENAAKHAREFEDNILTINAWCEPGKLVMRVSDNGKGIPPEAQAKLFCSKLIGGNTRGLGIGLTLSRELARAHGGDLKLESSGETGTVFVLTLKVVSETRLRDRLKSFVLRWFMKVPVWVAKFCPRIHTEKHGFSKKITAKLKEV